MILSLPDGLEKVREVTVTKDELVSFESKIAESYEAGNIRGPIHLAGNNEDDLIEIFSYIDKDDWVFAAWRNHYHALLHGISEDKLSAEIHKGRSMGINSIVPKFYSSSIVGGIIPIALGVAKALKRKGSDKKVWCFVGDMTSETGTFHEAYKYAKNWDLPIRWIIEDNDMSVHTKTSAAWNKKQEIPNDIIHYEYEMTVFPHHGTGKWVNF